MKVIRPLKIVQDVLLKAKSLMLLTAWVIPSIGITTEANFLSAMTDNVVKGISQSPIPYYSYSSTSNSTSPFLSRVNLPSPSPVSSPKRMATVSGSEVLEIKEAWNSANDPLRMGNWLQRQFSTLPLEGKINQPLWSDSYWPSYRGGLGYRWNYSGSSLREKYPFHFQTYSKEQVKQMPEKELKELSPAEKYDIYMGNFDYPLLRTEISRTSPSSPKWFGLCHGWAAATSNYSYEPRPVTMTSADGIKVPFGSSDVKALLALHQGQVVRARTYFLGERCDRVLQPRTEHERGRERESAALVEVLNLGPFIEDLQKIRLHPLFLHSCDDINAGAFHVVLSNFLGVKGQSFIGDMTRDAEVWNYPVYSYESEIISRSQEVSPGAAEGTHEEVEVKTQVAYATAVEPEWEAVGTHLEKKQFHYRLELNSEGEIIGGKWLKYARPDFLWVQETGHWTGYLKNAEEIYRAATTGR